MTHHPNNVIERVARAMVEVSKSVPRADFRDLAEAALEASHHAELVEALEMVVRGADSRNRSAPYVTKAIRVLTKIGGAA